MMMSYFIIIIIIILLLLLYLLLIILLLFIILDTIVVCSVCLYFFTYYWLPETRFPSMFPAHVQRQQQQDHSRNERRQLQDLPGPTQHPRRPAHSTNQPGTKPERHGQ